ncbi:hypothetical protein Bca101_087792 [Brassica carinata]
MFDTLCLCGLASGETRKEIAPPELITGRGTIKLPSRLIYPGKVSERIKHITLPEHFPKRKAPPHLELLQNVRAYTHLWFVDEVKPLAICEGRDETLDLEEVKSIQDKRDKWMLFPKRTIHGHLESTQLRQFMERRSLHISGGVRCAKRMFQVCHQANVESSESDQDLDLTSGEENSVNLLDNEEHIEGLSTPSTTPSTKRKGAWSDPPRDITSTSKNLRSKTIKVEKMSDLEAEAGKKT